MRTASTFASASSTRPWNGTVGRGPAIREVATGVQRAAIGDVEIAYETFGRRRDRPLVLIMGLATQMLGWHEELCELLAAQGFYVIRFDNRDIGLSTHHHETSDTPYRLEDLADDTAGLLDALGLASAHVAGTSMGGMIAQTLAIRHPRRVLSLTSIMSTPAPQIGPPTPEALEVLMASPPRDREDAARRRVEVFRVIGSPGYPVDADEVARLARRSYDRDHDPGTPRRQLTAVTASGDRTEALRALRVPALVIHGADDPLIQLEGGRATAAAIAGARLVVIEGMGHDLPRQLWPQIVAEIRELADAAEAQSR